MSSANSLLKGLPGSESDKKTKQIYFIAIIPPDQVCNEINKLRKQLLPGFNLASEDKKFPHITLQHTFRRLPEIENDLKSNLNLLAGTLKPFPVSTNNFSHFDHRILYISVENDDSLQKLYEEVQHLLLAKLNFNADEITKSFHPHITLEKKLTPELFEKGWVALHNATYKVTFIVHHFSLLKHNGYKWEPIAQFKLNG